MNPKLEQAVLSLERLSYISENAENTTAEDLQSQTQQVVDELTALMGNMQEGTLTLEKDEVIQLTASLQNALDILNKEAEARKAKLKAQLTNTQAHKSYSGS